jgi:hypothetical protein
MGKVGPQMATAKIELERQYYLDKLRCCLRAGTSLEAIHTLLRTLRLLKVVS